MTEEHHEVCVGDHSCLVHTSDMDESKKKEVIAAVGNTLNTTAYHQYEPSSYLYRKMAPEEFAESLKIRGIVDVDTGPRPQGIKTGEKWLTEDLTHTRRFKPSENQTVGEFRMPSDQYKKLREKAIPQQGSRALNQNQEIPSNLWHTELLRDVPGKRNFGLKGNANIYEFNSHVISVKQIDPASVTNRNAALHWLKNNKLTAAMTATGVALDGTTLIFAIIEDKGIGKNVVVYVSEIGLGHLAGYIGGLIGTSLLPGLGTIIGGIIGGLIGSLIGSLTSFFFGYNCVASGLGQPVGQSMADHGTPPAESSVNHGAPKSRWQAHHGAPQGRSTARHGFPTPSHQVTK